MRWRSVGPGGLGTAPILILAALVVVYLVLGVLYESYIQIGIILLIGIVKKNGIMMVDFAIAAEREQHLTPEQSIR